MISRNNPFWSSSQQKWKKCSSPALPPKSQEQIQKVFIPIATNKFLLMSVKASICRQLSRSSNKNLFVAIGIIACQVTVKILDPLCQAAVAGVTTQFLNDLSSELYHKKRAIPAPLEYGTPPFPKTVCNSLNELICGSRKMGVECSRFSFFINQLKRTIIRTFLKFLHSFKAVI